MHETAVKICGLQDVEVLKSMINLSIDYIGFVFAPSKRQITAAQGANLLQVLSTWKTANRPESVGVFVNPTADELAQVLEIAALDVVQLHGEESPEFCREVKGRFGVKVIKAFAVKMDGTLHGAAGVEAIEAYRGAIDGILVDAYDPVYGGGAGRTFAWEEAKPIQAWAKREEIPFLVAGGLHVDNVRDLIAVLDPDGVDVSSGVESDGMKDPSKISAFVERVKSR